LQILLIAIATIGATAMGIGTAHACCVDTNPSTGNPHPLDITS